MPEIVTRCILFAAAAVYFAILPTTQSAAQMPTSTKIVSKLKIPKAQSNSTRSLSVKDDKIIAREKFLRALPSRGITLGDRRKLGKLFSYGQLPAMDIEINFELASDKIMAISKPALDQLGTALENKSLAHLRIALNGHADATGENKYNQQLSERRAASVQQYLIEKFNIEKERLVAVGFGEERLKNEEDPEAPENRRVEVVNLSISLMILAE